MKKLILFIIVLLITVGVFAQKKHYAEVYVVNGVEAYILNEPVRPYEIVYGKGQGLSWVSFATGGLINVSISTKVGRMVKRIVKKAEEEGKHIDAVIYTTGKNKSLCLRSRCRRTPELAR